MSRPGFFAGVAIAAVLALGVAAGYAALAALWPVATLLELLIAAAAGVYVVILVTLRARHAGRVVLPLAWLLGAIVTAAWSPGPLATLALHAIAISLVRAFCCHASVLSGVADLALSALAVIAAIATARESGSVLLATWSFFLVQALFAAIPRDWRRRPDGAIDEAPAAGFERARSRAETALARLRTTA